jgi:hypothetical protein
MAVSSTTSVDGQSIRQITNVPWQANMTGAGCHHQRAGAECRGQRHTQDQFDSFGQITGGGTITAGTGDTFDLTGSNVDQDAAFNLAASDWSGTALIGNDQDNQTLTAANQTRNRMNGERQHEQT